MILEKTDRFDRTNVTSLIIAENEIDDLRTVFDRTDQFMHLLHFVFNI